MGVCLLPAVAFAQRPTLLERLFPPKTLRIQGTVLCLEHGNTDLEHPAGYVIVVPEGYGEGVVTTNEIGFFSFDLPYDDIINNALTIGFFNIVDTLLVRTIDINDGSIKNIQGERALQIPTLMLRVPCEDLPTGVNEMALAIWRGRYARTQNIQFTRKVRRRNIRMWTLGTIGAVSAILGGSSVVSASGYGGAPPGGAGGGFPVDPDTITYNTINVQSTVPVKSIDGNFLSLAFSAASQRTGSNLTLPGGTDRAFWNPAASFLPSMTEAWVHANSEFETPQDLPYLTSSTVETAVYSDFKNVVKSSVRVPVNGRHNLDAALMVLNYTQPYRIILDDDSSIVRTFQNKNWGLFVSESYKIKPGYLIGGTYKLINQFNTVPEEVNRVFRRYGADVISSDTLIRTSRKEWFHDLDLSAAYYEWFSPGSVITAGLTVMNLRNSKLNRNGKPHGSRAMGLGLAYFRSRMVVSSDYKLSKDNGANTSIGLRYAPESRLTSSVMRYIPLDRLNFSGGMSTEFNTAHIGLEYGNVYTSSISYSLNHSSVFGTRHMLGGSLQF